MDRRPIHCYSDNRPSTPSQRFCSADNCTNLQTQPSSTSYMCSCSDSSQQQSSSVYLERIKSDLQKKTTKLQAQQCQLIYKINQIEQFLNIGAGDDDDDVCHCEDYQINTEIPKVFPKKQVETPVRDVKPTISQSASESAPETSTFSETATESRTEKSAHEAATETVETAKQEIAQSCSFFKKVMDNAKCILSINCHCGTNNQTGLAPTGGIEKSMGGADHMNDPPTKDLSDVNCPCEGGKSVSDASTPLYSAVADKSQMCMCDNDSATTEEPPTMSQEEQNAHLEPTNTESNLTDQDNSANVYEVQTDSVIENRERASVNSNPTVSFQATSGDDTNATATPNPTVEGVVMPADSIVESSLTGDMSQPASQPTILPEVVNQPTEDQTGPTNGSQLYDKANKMCSCVSTIMGISPQMEKLFSRVQKNTSVPTCCICASKKSMVNQVSLVGSPNVTLGAPDVCGDTCPCDDLTEKTNKYATDSTAQNLSDMAMQEKDMKKYIEELQCRERAYQQTLKNVEDIMSKSNGCNCGGQSGSSNLQSELDRVSRELRVENSTLKSEVMDMKMQLKHCLEKIEGPMTQKLETEKMKCEQLQFELSNASKNMIVSQESYMRDMNSMKMQLCCACTNVNELNSMNRRLKDEMSQLDCMCAKLEEDLMKQKLSEADTIRRLSKRKIDDPTAKITKDFTLAAESVEQFNCPSNLAVIARNLSKTLHESEPCPECAKLPAELAGAARCIKELTDLVMSRKEVRYAENLRSANTNNEPRGGDGTTGGGGGGGGDKTCCQCCDCGRGDELPSPIKVSDKYAGNEEGPLNVQTLLNPSDKFTEQVVSVQQVPSVQEDSGNLQDYNQAQDYSQLVEQDESRKVQDLNQRLQPDNVQDYSKIEDIDSRNVQDYIKTEQTPDSRNVQDYTQTVQPDDSRKVLDLNQPDKVQDYSQTIEDNNSRNVQDYIKTPQTPDSRHVQDYTKTVQPVDSRKVLDLNQPDKVQDYTQTVQPDDSRKVLDLNHPDKVQDYSQTIEDINTRNVQDYIKTEQTPDSRNVQDYTQTVPPDESRKVQYENRQVQHDSGMAGDLPCPVHCNENASCAEFGMPCGRGKDRSQKTEGLLSDTSKPTVSAGGLPKSFKDTQDKSVHSGVELTDAGMEAKPNVISKSVSIPHGKSLGDIEGEGDASHRSYPGSDTAARGQPSHESMRGKPSGTRSIPSGIVPPGQLPFEERISGNFPFQTETFAEPLDHKISGVHVTTTITASGTLEVITEGPAGIIETILTYTDDGNLEVETVVIEMDEIDSDRVSGDRRGEGEALEASGSDGRKRPGTRRKLSDVNNEEFQQEVEKLKKKQYEGSGMLTGLSTAEPPMTPASVRSKISDQIPSEYPLSIVSGADEADEMKPDLARSDISEGSGKPELISAGIQYMESETAPKQMDETVGVLPSETIGQPDDHELMKDIPAPTVSGFDSRILPSGGVPGIDDSKVSERISSSGVTEAILPTDTVTRPGIDRIDIGPSFDDKHDDDDKPAPGAGAVASPLVFAPLDTSSPVQSSFIDPARSEIPPVASQGQQLPGAVPEALDDTVVPLFEESDGQMRFDDTMQDSKAPGAIDDTLVTIPMPEVSIPLDTDTGTEDLTATIEPDMQAPSFKEVDSSALPSGITGSVSGTPGEAGVSSTPGQLTSAVTSSEMKSSLTGGVEEGSTEIIEVVDQAVADQVSQEQKGTSIGDTLEAVGEAGTLSAQELGISAPTSTTAPYGEGALPTETYDDTTGGSDLDDTYPKMKEAAVKIPEQPVTTIVRDYDSKREECRRQLTESGCQSKSLTDQSCQCCECKEIGITTSGDKETLTDDDMGGPSKSEKLSDHETDSEYLTITDTESAVDAAIRVGTGDGKPFIETGEETLKDITLSKESSKRITKDDIAPEIDAVLSAGERLSSRASNKLPERDSARFIDEQTKELPFDAEEEKELASPPAVDISAKISAEASKDAVDEDQTLDVARGDATELEISAKISAEASKDAVDEDQTLDVARADTTESAEIGFDLNKQFEDQFDQTQELADIEMPIIELDLEELDESFKEGDIDDTMGLAPKIEGIPIKTSLFEETIAEESEPEFVQSDVPSTDNEDASASASEAVEKIFDAATSGISDEESKTATDVEEKISKDVTRKPSGRGEIVQEGHVCQSSCSTPIKREKVCRAKRYYDSKPDGRSDSDKPNQYASGSSGSSRSMPVRNTSNTSQSSGSGTRSCASNRVKISLPNEPPTESIEIEDSLKNPTVGLSLTSIRLSKSSSSKSSGKVSMPKRIQEESDNEDNLHNMQQRIHMLRDNLPSSNEEMNKKKKEEKEKAKLRSSPLEVPKIVSELSSNQRRPFDSNKNKTHRKKRGSKLSSHLHCTCQGLCRCIVCSPDIIQEREAMLRRVPQFQSPSAINYRQRYIETPPIQSQFTIPQQMAYTVIPGSRATTSSSDYYRRLDCQASTSSGIRSRKTSINDVFAKRPTYKNTGTDAGSDDEEDFEQNSIRRHSENCECIDCLTMPRIRELAATVEFPLVYDEKQIYQVTTKLKCDCVNAQNARNYVEQQRSRIPIAVSSSSPPKLRSQTSRPMSANEQSTPGADARPTASGNVYVLACDCAECKCDECGDQTKTRKTKSAASVKISSPSVPVGPVPPGSVQSVGKTPSSTPQGQTKNCCCKGPCTCEACPVDSLRQQQSTLIQKTSSTGKAPAVSQGSSAMTKPTIEEEDEEEEGECTCESCTCPGSQDLVPKPSEQTPKQGLASAKTSEQGGPPKDHPDDCDCEECACPGMKGPQAQGDVPVTQSKTSGKVQLPPEDCTCPKCECPGLKGGVRAADSATGPPGGDAGIADCDCDPCECRPCADPKKRKPGDVVSKPSGHTEIPPCDCADCKCSPCNDVSKPRPGSRPGSKPGSKPGSRVPSAPTSKLASAVPSSAGDTLTGSPTLDDCTCPLCDCASDEQLVSQKPSKASKTTSINVPHKVDHPPDCECPECACLEEIIAGEGETEKSVEVHAIDCTCDTCQCPDEEGGAGTAQVSAKGSTAVSGKVSVGTTPGGGVASVIGDGCLCGECLCQECFHKTRVIPHHEGCKCETCFCQECPIKDVALGDGVGGPISGKPSQKSQGVVVQKSVTIQPEGAKGSCCTCTYCVCVDCAGIAGGGVTAGSQTGGPQQAGGERPPGSKIASKQGSRASAGKPGGEGEQGGCSCTPCKCDNCPMLGGAGGVTAAQCNCPPGQCTCEQCAFTQPGADGEVPIGQSRPVSQKTSKAVSQQGSAIRQQPGGVVDGGPSIQGMPSIPSQGEYGKRITCTCSPCECPVCSDRDGGITGGAGEAGPVSQKVSMAQTGDDPKAPSKVVSQKGSKVGRGEQNVGDTVEGGGPSRAASRPVSQKVSMAQTVGGEENEYAGRIRCQCGGCECPVCSDRETGQLGAVAGIKEYAGGQKTPTVPSVKPSKASAGVAATEEKPELCECATCTCPNVANVQDQTTSAKPSGLIKVTSAQASKTASKTSAGAAGKPEMCDCATCTCPGNTTMVRDQIASAKPSGKSVNIQNDTQVDEKKVGPDVLSAKPSQKSAQLQLISAKGSEKSTPPPDVPCDCIPCICVPCVDGALGGKPSGGAIQTGSVPTVPNIPDSRPGAPISNKPSQKSGQGIPSGQPCDCKVCDCSPCADPNKLNIPPKPVENQVEGGGQVQIQGQGEGGGLVQGPGEEQLSGQRKGAPTDLPCNCKVCGCIPCDDTNKLNMSPKPVENQAEGGGQVQGQGEGAGGGLVQGPGEEQRSGQGKSAPTSLPCNCKVCGCEPCADPAILAIKLPQGSRPVSKQTSAAVTISNKEIPVQDDFKQLATDELKQKIEDGAKENCECRQHIEEIRKALEQIKCACTVAEQRGSQKQSIQQMSKPPSALRQAESQPISKTPSEQPQGGGGQLLMGNKPFVRKASVFDQTMSGLKMALLNLQEKCKAKDKLIEAMTGELKMRGSNAAFDKVITATKDITKAIDYDMQDDIKSYTSQIQTDVLFAPKEEREIRTTALGSSDLEVKTKVSKGVEVRTHKHKKKRNSVTKKDCACSKPQLIQTEDKDCQKIDLPGFEIVDIRRITTDSILIKWAAPNNSMVTGYDIFVNGVISSKVMSGARTGAMVHSLDLSKTVEIAIYAVTRCGRILPPAIAVYEIKS